MSGILDTFEPISLDEMDAVRLMNRTDTKFITSTDRLEQILELASPSYMVLRADGYNSHPYHSVYFDTLDRDMYLMHHNGRMVRQKVRTRTYVHSGDSYFEVKRKDNHGRTKKKRVEIDGSLTNSPWAEEKAVELLARTTAFAPESLSPSLDIDFTRITLANKAMTERLTIDTELSFLSRRTGRQEGSDRLVIIELKQNRLAVSEMKKILEDLRIHPFRISKYCVGTALTDPYVKQNRLKTKLHEIIKIVEQ